MTRMETPVAVKQPKNYTVRKKDTSKLEKLVKECNQLKINWGLKQNDIAFGLAISLMIECGFQCTLQKDDKKSDDTLPKDWKHKTRQIYEAQFILPPYSNCPVKLVALPAGEILCFNIIASNVSPKHISIKSLAIYSPVYVPRPEEDVVLNKFTDLEGFYHLLRNMIIWPIRCSILSDQGIINESLCGVPDEIKLKIFQFLPVADVLILSETCQDLYRICNSQSLWKILFHDYFKSHCKCSGSSQECDETTDWKETFRKCYIHKKTLKSLPPSPTESYTTATEGPYGSEIDFDID